MATRPMAHPTPPYQPSITGSLEQRLSDMAAAINRKADAGVATTAVPFVGLLDPTGATWRLSVDSTGALHTEVVPRT